MARSYTTKNGNSCEQNSSVRGHRLKAANDRKHFRFPWEDNITCHGLFGTLKTMDYLRNNWIVLPTNYSSEKWKHKIIKCNCIKTDLALNIRYSLI